MKTTKFPDFQKRTILAIIFPEIATRHHFCQISHLNIVSRVTWNKLTHVKAFNFDTPNYVNDVVIDGVVS